MTKRSLILWSGGYDSTALVMRSVAKNKPFDLLYVELENNKIKSEAELKAQDKILKKLKCEELLINKYVLKIGAFINKGDIKLTQPLFWLNAIMLYLREQHTEVQMGYYKGADPLNGTDVLFRTYKDMFELGMFEFNMPKLSIPFLFADKELLIRDWYFNDDYPIGKTILPHVWTCELPTKKGKKINKCGNCLPCISEKKTLFLINNFAEKDKIIKNAKLNKSYLIKEKTE